RTSRNGLTRPTPACAEPRAWRGPGRSGAAPFWVRVSVSACVAWCLLRARPLRPAAHHTRVRSGKRKRSPFGELRGTTNKPNCAFDRCFCAASLLLTYCDLETLRKELWISSPSRKYVVHTRR